MHSKRKLILGLSAAFGVMVTLAQDAFAVIGRPATPGSVAGVARRTARRNP
jgi:hypothetical protein